ncbi:MAG: VanZ family protein [Halobacteriota archaeon]
MNRPREHTARSLIAYGVVGLYAIAVLLASVVTPPGGLAMDGPFGVVGVDKWLHAAAYGTLAVGVAYAVRARRRDAIVTAVVVTVAFSTGIELVQVVVPTRSFDTADLVANAVGALSGGVCWALGVEVLDRRRRAVAHRE